jgi:hypothetical protein
MRIRLKDLLATKPTTSITTLGNKRLSNLKSTRKICGVVVICKYNEEYDHNMEAIMYVG